MREVSNHYLIRLFGLLIFIDNNYLNKAIKIRSFAELIEKILVSKAKAVAVVPTSPLEEPTLQLISD